MSLKRQCDHQQVRGELAHGPGTLLELEVLLQLHVQGASAVLLDLVYFIAGGHISPAERTPTKSSM